MDWLGVGLYSVEARSCPLSIHSVVPRGCISWPLFNGTPWPHVSGIPWNAVHGIPRTLVSRIPWHLVSRISLRAAVTHNRCLTLTINLANRDPLEKEQIVYIVRFFFLPSSSQSNGIGGAFVYDHARY